MKTVTISAIKMAKIHKLAKSMPQLTKVAALLKKAEDEGNLGPEEVKEIAEDTKQILLSVVEMVDDIVEGVPAEDTIVDDDDAVISDDIPKRDDDIPIVEGQEEDDKDKKKENEKIAKLQNQINEMKQASTHKELTIKYGKLFPDTIREAKEKEFAASKDSINILEARIKEASLIIKDRKSMKIAQLTTDGVTFIEDDDDTNNILNLKGKF